MKRLLLIFGAATALTAFFMLGSGWIRSQPVVAKEKALKTEIEDLPPRNKEIIAFIESNGERISPTYAHAVCTELVIAVINAFSPLTKDEKRDIRIITNEPLQRLIEQDAPIIRGVQFALVKSGKGLLVADPGEVMPGDFVQFWYLDAFAASGHCGIVKEIKPFESVTLYSSHPSTDGYGIQQFLWPDKIYFVRLKNKAQ
jgi:hypothetical protein